VVDQAPLVSDDCTTKAEDQATCATGTPVAEEAEEEALDDTWNTIDSAWDWDMLNASPPSSPRGAMVIDDYLNEDSERSDVPRPGQQKGHGNAVPAEVEPLAAESPKEQESTTPVLESISNNTTKDPGVPEELPTGYLCLTCDMVLLQPTDIISANFRAMTGPGFLTSAARNTYIGEEARSEVYTTGRYTVKEVMCSRCDAKLGITYVGAADPFNQHKIGKFLLGQDLMYLNEGSSSKVDNQTQG